ncbi:polymer-forming cytoskeletal protein [Methylacidimicrobium sp. B4]|uniref:bactofilin family protein n=1 Tax=Methylacidimicrobium sp. B4 TaxID=2796139 RepID=UPI001A8CD3AC|nr:polymer-forming cytoskeletal protein [Methylacidimicrobium sp. B4]QSR85354.1 polymer-forming cytoskeletal protein [Methylacidimicrobium sp. B4]
MNISTEAMKSQSENLGPKVTVLTRDTEFRGTVGFTGELQLNGRLEGEILSEDGTLVIGDTALVKADIRAKKVVVRGQVFGNILARERLEMVGSARVFGDVQTGALAIEQGAVFVGRSESLQADKVEKPDVASFFKMLSPGVRETTPARVGKGTESTKPLPGAEAKPVEKGAAA